MIIIRLVLLGSLALAGQAAALDKPAGRTPSIMVTCEAVADSRALAGADRRRFLGECYQLERRTPVSLQVQMASCEASARERRLSGDRLRAYIGRCMRA